MWVLASLWSLLTPGHPSGSPLMWWHDPGSWPCSDEFRTSLPSCTVDSLGQNCRTCRVVTTRPSFPQRKTQHQQGRMKDVWCPLLMNHQCICSWLQFWVRTGNTDSKQKLHCYFIWPMRRQGRGFSSLITVLRSRYTGETAGSSKRLLCGQQSWTCERQKSLHLKMLPLGQSMCGLCFTSHWGPRTTETPWESVV